MSSALRFSNLSKCHLEGDDYTTEILEDIGKIEQQTTFSCDDVINILKGFQNYKEQKPSGALKQKLTRWVKTYGEHINRTSQMFQILKYSDGVIDAGTLRPLLRACGEGRDNLLLDDQTEFDAICKLPRFAEFLPEPSFARNLTGQRQHLRQESEKSEDDTWRSRAAAGREPRENDPVETVIRKKRVHQIFHRSINVSDELLKNACLKKHDRQGRENLWLDDQTEFDAICKLPRFAEKLPESSFAPNLTGQRQHLRQESEESDSENSEDDTSRSRAAAVREPRETVPVETVICKKRVHQLFGHSRKMSKELLEDACLKMHYRDTVEPVAKQQAGNAVALVGGQPGQPTVNIYFNMGKNGQQKSKESDEESNGTSSKLKFNMCSCAYHDTMHDDSRMVI
jgi:hypothetical protein